MMERTTMGTAVAAAEEKTPDDYIAWMLPYAKRVVARQVSRHPYMGEDDLMQEALTVLWMVWRKFCTEKPFDDVCKLGTADMARMAFSWRQRSRAFGEGTAVIARMDAPLTLDTVTTLHGIVGDTRREYEPGASLETRDEFGAYCAGLTATEQAVFREVLSPSDRTVELMERVLRSSNARRTLVSARNAAIAQSLQLKPAVVTAAWKRIRDVVAQYQGRASRPSGYAAVSNSTRQES